MGIATPGPARPAVDPCPRIAPTCAMGIATPGPARPAVDPYSGLCSPLKVPLKAPLEVPPEGLWASPHRGRPGPRWTPCSGFVIFNPVPTGCRMLQRSPEGPPGSSPESTQEVSLKVILKAPLEVPPDGLWASPHRGRPGPWWTPCSGLCFPLKVPLKAPLEVPPEGLWASPHRGRPGPRWTPAADSSFFNPVPTGFRMSGVMTIHTSSEGTLNPKRE